LEIGWKRKAEELVDHALAEDWAWGDVTTQALIPPEAEGKATFIAKSPGVMAGIEVVHLVFARVDPSLEFRTLVHDGDRLQRGTGIATVEGKVGSILRGERVALNFLQRLSGIATETSRYVEAVRGTKARIVAALRARGLDLKAAIDLARKNAPHTLKIEVEVTTVEEAGEAIEAGADIIMLDNMSVEEMRRAVKSIGGRVLVEASGGVTLDNVRSVAETGVDLISVGALTHSVKSLDISLELEPSPH
jgi:nicotinate-nucleotide pyrophosphorylase (carboxylating)